MKKGISIELNFKQQDRFPGRLLSNVLSKVSQAVESAEYEEIEQAAVKFKKEISPFIFDTARYRLNQYCDCCFFVESTKQGSIIIGGAAAGLEFWLLKLTLGESIKKAWLDSELHHRLVRFFQINLGKKANRIASNISQQSDQTHIDGTFFHATVEEAEEHFLISVIVDKKYKYVPPHWEHLFVALDKLETERFQAHSTEKYIICCNDLPYSDRVFKELSRLGFYTYIYQRQYEVDDSGMRPYRAPSKQQAIWIQPKIPPKPALIALRAVLKIWPHLKYIELSSNPTNNDIFFGGSTETALERKLQPWSNEELLRIDDKISKQEFHTIIRSRQ